MLVSVREEYLEGARVLRGDFGRGVCVGRSWLYMCVPHGPYGQCSPEVVRLAWRRAGVLHHGSLEW